MEGYLYDGWNPVMITQLNAAASSETVLTRKWSCLWRPDVGSSLYARSSWQKAGGVGGLAWLQTGAAQTLATDNLFSLQGTCEIHIPMGDHMGNIRNYIHARATTVNDGSGPYAMVNFTPSANFEYDAFGREVRANGTTVAANPPPPAAPITPPGLTAGTSYADALPFHYSSKFTDPESGLNYYGYRYYDPKDGRWLNRDPIGERGGLNLHGMCFNNAINLIDRDGRAITLPLPNSNAPPQDSGIRIHETFQKTVGKCEFIGYLTFFIINGKGFYPMFRWEEKAEECCEADFGPGGGFIKFGDEEAWDGLPDRLGDNWWITNDPMDSDSDPVEIQYNGGVSSISMNFKEALICKCGEIVESEIWSIKYKWP